MLAVADKTLFDSFISGTIPETQLPNDAFDTFELVEDEKDEPNDFLVPSSLSASTSTLSEWDTVSLVLEKERSVHNSRSVLVAPNKDFKVLFNSQTDSKTSTSGSRPVHDRYQTRPEQEYYKNIGLGTDDIDTRGSMFLSASERGASQPSSSSAARVPAAAPRERRPAAEPVVATEAKRAKTGLKPIIVVPGSAASPINRFNMVKFFGEGVFEAIDPNDPNLDDSAPHRADFKRIKENGEEIPYEVADNTSKFTPSDWERVIAIFTMGKLWQFKAYPYGEERVADMFQRHCGFYIRLGTEKIPQDTVTKWKVRVLSVSKSHRHTDAATLREFWDTIDNFVQTSKIHHLKT